MTLEVGEKHLNRFNKIDKKQQLKEEWKVDGRESFIIDDAWKGGKSEAEEETQKKVEELIEYIKDNVVFSNNSVLGGSIDRMKLNNKIDKIFSPRINVEGKPMIPPTPKTSGKDNLVTEDKLSRKEEIEKEIETLGNFGSQDKSNIMGQLKARLDERIRVEQDFLKMIDEIDCSCLGVHSKKDCFKEELKSLLQDKKQ